MMRLMPLVKTILIFFLKTKKPTLLLFILQRIFQR